MTVLCYKFVIYLVKRIQCDDKSHFLKSTTNGGGFRLTGQGKVSQFRFRVPVLYKLSINSLSNPGVGVVHRMLPDKRNLSVVGVGWNIPDRLSTGRLLRPSLLLLQETTNQRDLILPLLFFFFLEIPL